MPAHFTLDVDPDELRAVQQRVATLAGELDASGGRATRVPERPAVAQWYGDAADAIKPEMAGLGAVLRDLGGDLTSIAGAIGSLQRTVSEVHDELPRLNREWEQAATDCDAALEVADRRRREAVEEAREAGPLTIEDEYRINRVNGSARSVALSARASRQAALTDEFEALRRRVAQRVRALGAALVDHTPIEVPAVALEELRTTGTVPTYRFDAGSLLTGLTVTRDYLAETDPTAAIELTLREEGLLTGPPPTGFYLQWLENAARRGVSPETVADIARTHEITAQDFELLEDLQEVMDPDGKSFFLVPDDLDGDDARRAVIMTYILNAGTDYGDASGSNGTDNDFEETPYSAAEVQRILDRQDDNRWSYDDDVGFVHANGGRMVTTPNGILMGLGGNWLQDLYSQNGGTAWGDIFMINIDDPEDLEGALREVVESGRATYTDDDGDLYQGALDLDRLLHHEERHSQQWAREGYTRFLASYGWEQLTGGNGTEEDAGLADGGYH